MLTYYLLAISEYCHSLICTQCLQTVKKMLYLDNAQIKDLTTKRQ